MNFVVTALILFGLLGLTVAAVGVIRFPDFYTRSHAVGVMDTVGTLLILSGLALHHGFSLVSGKLLFLLVFIYLANPTITHVLVRAALKSGLEPWTKKTGAQ